MSKKLARIYLPVANNNGFPVVEAHEWLKRSLINSFGGWTAIPHCIGAWKDASAPLAYIEEIVIYEVFADNVPTAYATLIQIATTAGFKAQQLAVSVVLPNGDVSIIEIPETTE